MGQKKTYPFKAFIDEKLKAFNERTGKEWTTNDLASEIRCSIDPNSEPIMSYELFRKKINGRKPSTKRDLIIAIGVLLHFDSAEVDEALALNKMVLLNEVKEGRDQLISSLIDSAAQLEHQGKQYDLTLDRLNYSLSKRNFSELDLHSRRNSSKKTCSTRNMIHFVWNSDNIHTYMRNQEYLCYGDIYNSLATQYSPLEYIWYGDLPLVDQEGKRHLLSSDTQGHDKLDGKTVDYSDLGVSEAYKICFMELHRVLQLEKSRTLATLKDTKNYIDRSSARVINGGLCVFAEAFNYSIPLINEYYLVSRSKSEYKFNVYKESAFMSYYLNPQAYKTYYHSSVPELDKEYTSIEEINLKIDTTEDYAEKEILRIQAKKFEELKTQVDDLYKRIKNKEAYINNLKYAFENPLEVLSYYRLDNDFECEYDEMGIIVNCISSKKYTLDDGQVVYISLEDLYTAFELGLDGIDEIRRLKIAYRKLSNILQ